MASVVNISKGGWDAPMVDRSIDIVPMGIPMGGPLLGAGIGGWVGYAFAPPRYRIAAAVLGLALGWGAGMVVQRGP